MWGLFSTLRGIFDILSIFKSIYSYTYLYIIYIYQHETTTSVTGQDSTSVERRSMTWKGRGFESRHRRWNLSSKLWDFFLLIEDKDYSKSRTKIGLSVDISVKKQKALEPKTQ